MLKSTRIPPDDESDPEYPEESPRRRSGRADQRVPPARHISILPNLVTLGNAVCGFAALGFIAKFHHAVPGTVTHLEAAAWLILLGMVFDVFDGRVARMTGTTSALGAQLDSLCDLVTFGLAPAGLMVKLHKTVHIGGTWDKVVWLFGLAYFLGALLRLARFNVEHENSSEEHLCFKGMPTPAAAGCVAGLVICYFWLDSWQSWELRLLSDAPPLWASGVQSLIAGALPFLSFFCGFAMVAHQLRYPHVPNFLFRRASFDTLVYLVFGLTLVFITVELFLGVVFLTYLIWAPVQALRSRSSAIDRWGEGDSGESKEPAPGERESPSTPWSHRGNTLPESSEPRRTYPTEDPRG